MKDLKNDYIEWINEENNISVFIEDIFEIGKRVMFNLKNVFKVFIDIIFLNFFEFNVLVRFFDYFVYCLIVCLLFGLLILYYLIYFF